MPVPDPITRQEQFLAAAANGSADNLPDPITREEVYLKAIAENAGGGGGGGSSTLAGLTDVDLSNPTDGQTLVYDAASSKWVNGSGGSGGFTVLQGTFSDSGGLSTITLGITASVLFTLLQTSAVSVAWTETNDGFTDSYITPIDKCMQSVEDDNTVYVFQVLAGLYLTQNLSASDAVVFEMTQ